jgi:hypothetical protein
LRKIELRVSPQLEWWNNGVMEVGDAKEMSKKMKKYGVFLM